MTEAILWQFEISPVADKVRRILNVTGVAYETRDPKMGDIAAFKKKSPAGRLPVLEHGGRLIADSTDIALYLEEAFPQPALLPADPALRGEALILEDWADESLYWYELTMRLTWETNAPAVVGGMLKAGGAPALLVKPFTRQVMKTYGKLSAGQGVGAKPRAQVLTDLARITDSVQSRLAGRAFLVGDALSIADIAVFVQLACIRGTVEGGPLFAARPGLSAWMDQIDAATRRRG
jgi:glutathione S-transferase